MARKTEIITINIKFDIDFLFDLGMIPNVPGFKMKSNCIEVVVDGRIVGFIDENTSISFVAKIRKIRCLKNLKIEVVLFAKDYDLQSMYPGVFIFTNVGRLTRPVFNNENKVEYIGIMEQVFLYIKKASDDDIIKDYDNKAKNYDDEKNIYKKINSEVYKIEENNSNNRKINLEENYNDEENNSNNKKINSEEYNKNKEPNFYKNKFRRIK
ncbi:DNA-directed RNA polymerase I subunit RPA2 [Gurleya vavrai]